jgi:hypothetical protein
MAGYGRVDGADGGGTPEPNVHDVCVVSSSDAEAPHAGNAALYRESNPNGQAHPCINTA